LRGGMLSVKLRQLAVERHNAQQDDHVALPAELISNPT